MVVGPELTCSAATNSPGTVLTLGDSSALGFAVCYTVSLAFFIKLTYALGIMKEQMFPSQFSFSVYYSVLM